MSSNAKQSSRTIRAVNYHLLEQCNMACSHCFVTDIAGSRDGVNNQVIPDQENHIQTFLPPKKAIKIIRMLCDFGFKKINFAGGEPLLYPKLDHLVREAKKAGMITSIVTNGVMINEKWLDSMKGYLDWIALSIDSMDAETHRQSGRATKLGPMTTKEYMKRIKWIKRRRFRLKINTVVTIHNWKEDMTEFIMEAKPERWKIMQALPIRGQNDLGKFAITREQFSAFMEKNQTDQKDIKVVPEDNDLMTGSYVMISPSGQFFDNVDGRYKFSSPIIQVGVDAALDGIRLDYDKFKGRGGDYDW